MTKPLPSVEYLRECFDVDFSTGVATWKERPRSHFLSNRAYRRFMTRYAGERAGSWDARDEYWRVKISGARFYLHRIIFAMFHGAATAKNKEIDHINHDGNDNRISNLRLVDKVTNLRNARISKRNKTGVIGVYRDQVYGSWIAGIGHEGRLVIIGRFAEFEEAVKARKSAEREYGYHRNHGLSIDQVGVRNG